jgi:hypothetical protein
MFCPVKNSKYFSKNEKLKQVFINHLQLKPKFAVNKSNIKFHKYEFIYAKPPQNITDGRPNFYDQYEQHGTKSTAYSA